MYTIIQNLRAVKYCIQGENNQYLDEASIESRLYTWALYNLLWQNPKFSEFYHLKQKQAALNLMTKIHLKYPEKSVKISSCMSKFLQSV